MNAACESLRQRTDRNRTRRPYLLSHGSRRDGGGNLCGFLGIQVSDGTLNVEFIAVAGDPRASVIETENAGRSFG